MKARMFTIMERFLVILLLIHLLHGTVADEVCILQTVNSPPEHLAVTKSLSMLQSDHKVHSQVYVVSSDGPYKHWFNNIDSISDYEDSDEAFEEPKLTEPDTKPSEAIPYSYLNCYGVILISGQQLDYHTEDQNLKYVTVLNTNLTVIPSGVFSKYASIKELYLNDTSTLKLNPGAFLGLANLKELYLQNNQIQKLPGGVFNNLIYLKILNVTNNRIEVIQEETFLDLFYLKSVDLSHNKLRQLPQVTFYNAVLMELVDLSFNNISALPQQLVEESGPNLNINLCSNNLTVVDFLSFPNNLRYLQLGNNYITAVHNWEYLENLIKLDVSNNCLQNVTAAASGLKDFNISHNNLTSINGTFRQCSDLEVLDLSHNSIRSLDEDAFVGLRHLRELLLDFNAFTYIPMGLFRDLSSLAKLAVSYNKISEINYGTFQGLAALTHLNISGNQLASLSVGAFYELSTVVTMDMSYNNLTTLNANDLKEYLPYLQFLDIRGNPWQCKALLKILKTIRHSRHGYPITNVKGTDLTSQGFKGIACTGDNKDNEEENQSKEKSGLTPSDVRSFLDSAFKAYFSSYLGNGTKELQLNNTMKAFLDSFNGGFQNTTFYKYFSGNFSNALREPTASLRKLFEEFKRFQNVSLDSMDRFGAKLQQLLNANFKNSEFRNFFEKSFNVSDFFNGLNSEVRFDLKEIQQFFGAKFNSTLLKMFNQSLEMDRNASQLNFRILKEIDGTVSKAFDKLASIENKTALQSHSEFLTSNSNSETKTNDRLVTLNIIIIVIMLLGIVSLIVHNHIEKKILNRKLMQCYEEGSTIRITRADLEM